MHKHYRSQDFRDFMREREAAAQAYASGETAPLEHIVTHGASATFFGPKGGYETGADHVYDIYRRDAGHFSSGDSHFEVLQMAEGGDVAFWTGLQHAEVKLDGGDKEVPMHLRVTEVFRREDGAWKMVHRHADMLTEEQAAQTGKDAARKQ
jgi:ketosteroid isomerase-like protein